MIKDTFDKKFGSTWHVVVGQDFSFDVTSEVCGLFYLCITPCIQYENCPRANCAGQVTSGDQICWLWKHHVYVADAVLCRTPCS